VNSPLELMQNFFVVYQRTLVRTALPVYDYLTLTLNNISCQKLVLSFLILHGFYWLYATAADEGCAVDYNNRRGMPSVI